MTTLIIWLVVLLFLFIALFGYRAYLVKRNQRIYVSNLNKMDDITYYDDKFFICNGVFDKQVGDKVYILNSEGKTEVMNYENILMPNGE